jgi:hypothetical protein
MAQFDPKRPENFLDSGRSAKHRFCGIKLYEAAVGDLTLPAKWTLKDFIPKQ